jgi:hypothetical protein
MAAPVATTKATNKTVPIIMSSNPSEEMPKGLCGHSGEWNLDFGQYPYRFLDAATFLLRDERGRWHRICQVFKASGGHAEAVTYVGEIEVLGACTKARR